MPQVKARVDALIQQLRDLSPEVRLEAIEELATIDREHALPALHWAIQNELDDTVRNVARDAYQKLYAQNKAAAQNGGATQSVDKTRAAYRPKVKAVVMEEGAPNPAGQLSFYMGFGILGLMFIWMLLSFGHDQTNLPGIFIYWRLGVGALAIPGLGLGILGLIKKGEKHVRAIAGTVINGILVLIYFFRVILPLLTG